jgi:hypothetical protein
MELCLRKSFRPQWVESRRYANWAMMLMGFAGVGMVMRSTRRRKPAPLQIA